MSAARLRDAAALMRERAEAIEIPWHPYNDTSLPSRSTPADFMHDMQGYLGGSWGDHAGSWHPVVALAVADWLESEIVRAEFRERQQRETNEMLLPHVDPYPCYYDTQTERAIAVADAYLSETRGGSDE